MPGSIHHILVSTATGLVLLGSAAAFAEHRDTIIVDPDVQRTDARSSDFRSNDLSGGFYDDNYKIDDWYYDFYESPSVRRTDDRTLDDRTRVDRTGIDRTVDDRTVIERRTRIKPDAIKTSERTRFVDAARPIDTQPSNRHTQASAFTRYYDEPWYYEQRDEAYVLPARAVHDDSYRSTTQETITGNVTGLKQVRNTTNGGQNTVARVKPLKGNPMIVDLGPTQPLLNLALTKGDSISVGGQNENIGPYSVLMANQVRSGANKVIVHRGGADTAYDRREANGRIERFSDARIRGTEQVHRMASIRGDDGRLMLVDLGPSTALNVPANAAPGDRMSASGPVATVGNYPVIFADRMSIENGVPIKIARPDGDYPGAYRREMESSQILDSPTQCVGGHCAEFSTPQSTIHPQAR